MPRQDSEALDFRIGLDDVYEDARGLRSRLEQVAPFAVCFNSKDALARAAGLKIVGEWQGESAAEWIQFEGVAVIWAVPDSSPRARKWHGRRVSLLTDLCERMQDCLSAPIQYPRIKSQ